MKNNQINASQSLKIARVMIMFMLFIVVLSSVNAQPPVNPTTQVTSSELRIETPPFGIWEVGKDHRVHAHVFNTTAIQTNKTTTCYLHFYNSTGWDADLGAKYMEWESYNDLDFALTIGAGNFSQVGYYSHVIQCNNSNQVTAIATSIEVTNNGLIADEGLSIFHVGSILILLILLGFTIFSFSYFDNLLNRVGMLGIMYILLIAITYVGWNMTSSFMNDAVFLTAFLRLIFLVLVIGFFPMVIAGFVYYFLSLWKIKEIQNLIEKGMPESEAYERTTKKNKFGGGKW